MRRMFGRLYRGEYSMSVALLGFLVGGTFAVCLAAALLGAFLLFFVRGDLVYVMILVLLDGYWCIVLVGIWRTASTGRLRPIYRIVAKAIVVLFIANIAWSWVNGETFEQVRLVQAVINSN